MHDDASEALRPILPVSVAADRRARQFEKRARMNRNRELALIIDNETGHAVGDQIPGERTRIIFTAQQLRSMWGRILSHNHPGGWTFPEDDLRHAGSGFSTADIALFFECGLAEMRVVTPGYLYRLRMPDDPEHPARRFYGKDVARSIERVFHAIWADLMAEERLGLISSAMREHLINHLAMIELERQWGIVYEREECP